jgi:hypothetical protein
MNIINKVLVYCFVVFGIINNSIFLSSVANGKPDNNPNVIDEDEIIELLSSNIINEDKKQQEIIN